MQSDQTKHNNNQQSVPEAPDVQSVDNAQSADVAATGTRETLKIEGMHCAATEDSVLTDYPWVKMVVATT